MKALWSLEIYATLYQSIRRNNISGDIRLLSVLCIFFLEKGLVADATDAPQPWGLLCNPCNEDEEKGDQFFSIFQALLEWNWQGKTEVFGGKPVPVPLCPPQIPHGLTRDLTRTSATNCLSHGTVMCCACYLWYYFPCYSLPVYRELEQNSQMNWINWITKYAHKTYLNKYILC
jgi:hypothetical protein